ncbi:hypothetical protein ABID42_000564 [Arcicella rosea]|uniref:SIR2 family protein n=1 Tax=Arcicella rosea TaxID=502909 RepID=UPI00345C9733
MTSQTSETPKTGEWKYILLNGKSKRLEVLNPEFNKGSLESLEEIRPFKKDEENTTPSVEIANRLMREGYVDFFKKPFKNLLILSGAGSSIDVGGPLMSHLWTKVEEKYRINGIDGFSIIRKSVNFSSPQQDLEALLSQIEGYSKFAGDIKITIDSKVFNLSEIKDSIFEIIKHNCTIAKPTGVYPHKIFLEKLLQRKQTNPRVKVFTLNYDLLFEYAATEVNAIIIDGFSFTFPRTFSGRLFDYDIVQREGSKLQEEDNFIQRVFHLHKLHGSLNWEREIDGRILVKDNPKKPLMVYPREAKYEDSYEQPFFEMMARFQRSLRINNDTLLISIGYSFNDKHINAAIEEALNQNPSFRLAVINPQFDDTRTSDALKQIKLLAEHSERVILISEKFIDFANFFPEIQTYDTETYNAISLKNDK